ncbi:hypothetical protein [Nocardioides marmorisolisilvae]|uniref:Lipoprotein n=1 Tax=Nocardioides marmorisolisilvae TaxID=1542737 RepID=A0A3N0DPH2_9ACTN|nr:hypothetical protein [Nocardioides marmorisolisilvae]RNL77547.1 hypothetical protein EFL95_16155 [Nocardioides marmorisolisilvae]
MTTSFRRTGAVLAAVIAAGTLAGCGGGSKEDDSRGTELVGLLKLAPGAVKGGKVSGTWFRMVQVGGTVKNGPFMKNADSKADGGEVTLLRPGTSGGLRLEGYQSQPVPAFAANGDSLANAIVKPARFFAVAFSISTNPVDPQTKRQVAPPTVYVKDGRLSADLSSWGVTWNKQVFNQGAPKPVPDTAAKAPGQEKAAKVWDWVAGKYLESAPAPTLTGTSATGTFDAKSGRFTLEWTSLIEGGPFNRFIGRWHLEGTFVKDGRAPDA